MSVMTPRRLEQLRKRAELETRQWSNLPATSDYVIGLKMRVLELEEQRIQFKFEPASK